MSNKGPLDQFYRDCLRVGNLKVRRYRCACGGQLLPQRRHACSRPAPRPRPIRWGYEGSMCLARQPCSNAAWLLHAVAPLHGGPTACSAALLSFPHPRPCLAAQCFSHFSLYLKGREELVVTIYHGLLPASQQPPIARVGSVGCGPSGTAGGRRAAACTSQARDRRCTGWGLHSRRFVPVCSCPAGQSRMQSLCRLIHQENGHSPLTRALLPKRPAVAPQTTRCRRQALLRMSRMSATQRCV